MYQRDERALLAPVLLLATVFPAFAQPKFDPARVIRSSPCCLFSLSPDGPDLDAFEHSGANIFRAEIAFEGASKVILLDATSQGQNIVVTGVAFAGTLRREFAAFLDRSGQVIHVIPIHEFEPRAVCIGSGQTLWIAGQPMRRQRDTSPPLLRHYRFDGHLLGEYVREPLGGSPRIFAMGENVAITLPGVGDWLELGPTGTKLRRVKLPGTGEITGAAVIPGRAFVSVGTKLYTLGLDGESWTEIVAPPDFDRLLGTTSYLDSGYRIQALPQP